MYKCYGFVGIIGCKYKMVSKFILRKNCLYRSKTVNSESWCNKRLLFVRKLWIKKSTLVHLCSVNVLSFTYLIVIELFYCIVNVRTFLYIVDCNRGFLLHQKVRRNKYWENTKKFTRLTSFLETVCLSKQK